MALITCKQCGHKISDKALKCPKCGTLTVEEEVPVVEENQNVEGSSLENNISIADNNIEYTNRTIVQNNSKQKNNKTTICTILIIILLASCIVIGWYFISVNSTKKSVSTNIPIATSTVEFTNTKVDEKLGDCLNRYKNIDVLGEGFAKVEDNGKYGCINSQGNLIIPCEFNNISKFDDGFIVTKDKYGVLDLEGKNILLCEYNDIWFWIKDCVNGTLSNLSYDYLGKGPLHIDIHSQELLYNNYRITVQKKDSTFDWSNGKLTKHIDENVWIETDKTRYIRTGDNMTRILSKEENKWGYGDKNGNIIIPCIYDAALDFYNGLAIVLFESGNLPWENKYGIIDKQGCEVTSVKYSEILRCSDGFLVKSGDMMGALDNNGKKVIDCKYIQISNYKGDCDYLERYDRKKKIFENDLTVVQNKNNKFGYVDFFGKEIINCKYDDAYDFSEGLALVKMNEKIGYIDKEGNTVIPFKYDSGIDFYNSMAIVHNDKYGIIDMNGNEIVAPLYDGITMFSKEYFFAQKDGKNVFIRKDGKVVN